jgi:hypothetical protein
MSILRQGSVFAYGQSGSVTVVGAGMIGEGSRCRLGLENHLPGIGDSWTLATKVCY